MAKIAVYVQSKYTLKYEDGGYNKRAWPGMELIKDAIIRGGYDIDYASAHNVTDYDIILHSITSPVDWYSFIDERTRWPKGNYKVIIGGAGNLNIRPVLEYADIFVFGRGEDIINPLLDATLKNEKYDHPSVCYAEDFSNEQRYYINQTKKPYPHAIRLANGKIWRETTIGCQKKCLFCSYSWQRRHIGFEQSEAGAGDALWSSSKEYTIFDFDLDNPGEWFLGEKQPPYIIIGIDGFSERLRFKVLKPITDEMIYKLLIGAADLNTVEVKLYNIVGYPTETFDDWLSFRRIVERVDATSPPSDDPWYHVTLHNTPFKAMPATPSAVWPMSYRDYRGKIARLLRDKPYQQKWTTYRGNLVRLTETTGTESLPTVALWALAIRGTEQDAEVMRLLSTSSRFQRASGKVRLATIEKYVDVDRIFGEYSWDNLPTRYLESYVPQAGMAKLSNRFTGGRYGNNEKVASATRS